jgi:FixJ family two-component response regulator
VAGLPPHITVIDDSPAVRSGLGRLLRSQGIEVTTRESAEEFLASLPSADSQPTFLIADVRLPGASGIQLLRQLRAEGNPVPAILITAHEEAETSVELSTLGSPVCLRKPFTWAVLEDAIRALWSSSSEVQM